MNNPLKIFEAKHGGDPQNYHIDHFGDTLNVTLVYPSISSPGKAKYIQVNQESVRASDGIRMHYDYQRDGFVIEQPKDIGNGNEEWVEVFFAPSWALEKPCQP